MVESSDTHAMLVNGCRLSGLVNSCILGMVLWQLIASNNAVMSQEKPVFDYHEESQSEKLARKTKESPFMAIAIAGCLGAVGYGAYTYKNRGKMSTSVFLMQFRVIAQGTAVGALCGGVVYTLYNNHFNKPKENIAILPKSNEH